MNLARPILTVLNDEQIAQIHDYSLQVLSSVGMRVHSEPARQLLGKAAGPGFVDGDRVYIPRELVHWALQAVPATVKVYDRRGALSFELPGQTRFDGVCLSSTRTMVWQGLPLRSCLLA